MDFWRGKASGIVLMGTGFGGHPSSEHVQSCVIAVDLAALQKGWEAGQKWRWLTKGLSAEWLRGLSAPGWSQAVTLEILSSLLQGKVQGSTWRLTPQEGSLGH